MKLHGICLIKNEFDILRYSMREAARWFDRIYIYDNGSTDGTWELAQELAKELPQMVIFKRDERPYRDCLRHEVFNSHRHEASVDDWWCRLDADEVYIDNPREFLAAVPRRHHVVWSVHLQFQLTEEDLARFSPEDEVAVPEFTAASLPRCYVANASEARFFRHRPGLEWPADGSWPRHMGLVTPKRIRLRHLQYRSPGQIQRRLDTRALAVASGYQHFGHSVASSWRDKVHRKGGLTCETGDGDFPVDETLLPRHLESPWQRAVKYAMHGLGVWP